MREHVAQYHRRRGSWVWTLLPWTWRGSLSNLQTKADKSSLWDLDLLKPFLTSSALTKPNSKHSMSLLLLLQLQLQQKDLPQYRVKFPFANHTRGKWDSIMEEKVEKDRNAFISILEVRMHLLQYGLLGNRMRNDFPFYFSSG